MNDDTYKDLGADEEDAILNYLEVNNPAKLAAIISQNNMTKDMCRFVADIITGKVKRKPRKKPSTDLRDIQIYIRIEALLSDGHNLTSNSSKDGAAAIITDEFSISEEAAIKAHSRIKNTVVAEGLSELFQEFENLENVKSHGQ